MCWSLSLALIWVRHDAVGAVHGLLVAHHEVPLCGGHGFAVDLVCLLGDLGVDDLGVKHPLDLGQLRRCDDMQDVGQVFLKQCPGIRRFQRNRAFRSSAMGELRQVDFRGDYDPVGRSIVSRGPSSGWAISQSRVCVSDRMSRGRSHPIEAAPAGHPKRSDGCCRLNAIATSDWISMSSPARRRGRRCRRRRAARRRRRRRAACRCRRRRRGRRCRRRRRR